MFSQFYTPPTMFDIHVNMFLRIPIIHINLSFSLLTDIIYMGVFSVLDIGLMNLDTSMIECKIKLYEELSAH